MDRVEAFLGKHREHDELHCFAYACCRSSSGFGYGVRRGVGIPVVHLSYEEVSLCRFVYLFEYQNKGIERASPERNQLKCSTPPEVLMGREMSGCEIVVKKVVSEVNLVVGSSKNACALEPIDSFWNVTVVALPLRIAPWPTPMPRYGAKRRGTARTFSCTARTRLA